MIWRFGSLDEFDLFTGWLLKINYYKIAVIQYSLYIVSKYTTYSYS